MKTGILIIAIFLLLPIMVQDVDCRIVCLPIPTNFPHITTFGYDMWDLALNLDQAKWLAARQDIVIGGNGNRMKLAETVYDAMKAVNSNIKFLPYIAYNTYEPPVQNRIKTWCEANGYDFEKTFYHYYYDTTVLLRGSNPARVLVKGFGGGTAATIQEARVPSSWAQYGNGGFDQTTGLVVRLNINPTSKEWRMGYQANILENQVKINAAVGKYADGIHLDTFEGTVYNAFDLQLERTIEMRDLGKLTRADANAQATNDLIAAMHELKSYLEAQTGRPMMVVPNIGDADSIYEWRKFIYGDRIKEYTHMMIETMIPPGASTYRITRLKQVYDSMTKDGIIFLAVNATKSLTVTERTAQFLIASHYLVNHPNYVLMYHRGSPASWGGNPSGQLYTTHWHKNLEYDVGSPIKRTEADSWGIGGTDRFYTFANIKDADPLKAYTILGREYDKALVLAKFGAKGGIANVGTNPTTHNLPGTYRLLQPDNSLGPPVTSITLGASEGAILIK